MLIMLQGLYFFTLPLVCLSSTVVDEYSQNAVIAEDYCPNIAGCQEGTHVMCLYYDPNNKMGPGCVNVVDINMTIEDVHLIVDICNRIRSKIANGLGKGEENMELPRGYGMLKLSWDPELATLAQLWANQCILKTDPCRATERFHDPGQVIGTRRYTLNDWTPISMSDRKYINKFNSTTLTPDKIREGIISILKAWYEMKDDVTPDMIMFMDLSAKLRNNQFLQLVSGKSSHMGCGISGYTQYFYSNNNAALNYNIFQIVCNFSYRPHVGDSVYTTTPPKEPGYTLRCGCPLGYDEDEDCLCYETDREMPFNCKETGRCKSSVVVLPIFTVEDAPLHILKQHNISHIINTPAVRHEDLKRIPFIDYTRANKNDVQIIKQDSFYKTRRVSTDVRNRYFGENSKSTNKLKTKPPHGEHTRKNIHKQSIFAKAAVFELPSSKIKQVVQNATPKQNVKPRKDFSKVQKLVFKYLEGRRKGQPFYLSNDNLNSTYIKSVTIAPYSSSNKVNRKIHNLSRFPKHKFTYYDLNLTRTSSPKDEMKPLYEENDLIFMNLLDKLEEEVNNIDFNTKEKNFFDEKIRKIYGTLVKKSVVTEHSMVNRNLSMNKDIKDNDNVLNNGNRRNYWLDSHKPNEYLYSNLEARPINEKSMTKYYDKNDRDVGNNIYAKKYNKSYRSNPLNNNNIGDRKLRDIHPRKKSHFNFRSKGNPRHDNYYLNSDLNEYNSLESQSRRFFNDELNNLERKVGTIKKHGRNNFISEGLHLRPVRPSKQSVRRSRPQEMDLYMPNRARFVLGF